MRTCRLMPRPYRHEHMPWSDTMMMLVLLAAALILTPPDAMVWLSSAAEEVEQKLRHKVNAEHIEM